VKVISGRDGILSKLLSQHSSGGTEEKCEISVGMPSVDIAPGRLTNTRVKHADYFKFLILLYTMN
jgi:hypothetical protein